MTEALTPEEEDAALAAEYVVGLLSAEDRAVAEQRLRGDRAFAARVETWEVYFAGLNDEYGTVQPAARIKAAIDARLFGPATRKRARWLPGALIASALAVMVMFVVLPLLVADDPTLTAALDSVESGYRFEVEVREDNAAVDIALVAGAVVDDRTFELWLIPDDGTPRSLGTFDQAQQLQIVDAASLISGAVLAVSLEPTGGSPTGAPTGPVLAVGTLTDA